MDPRPRRSVAGGRSALAGLVSALAVVTCGGEKETLPKIDSAPLEATLVEACTRLASCSGATTFPSVSQCLLAKSGPRRTTYTDRVITGLNSLGGARFASMACLSAARGDCSAINQCVPRPYRHLPGRRLVLRGEHRRLVRKRSAAGDRLYAQKLPKRFRV